MWRDARSVGAGEIQGGMPKKAIYVARPTDRQICMGTLWVTCTRTTDMRQPNRAMMSSLVRRDAAAFGALLALAMALAGCIGACIIMCG